MSRLSALFRSATSAHRPAAANVPWLALDRSLRLGVSFVVQLCVVRYLGPAGNGILQIGLALAALCAVGVELGLDTVVKRELVRRPAQAGALLGTALLLRAALFLPGVLVFAWAAAREPGLTRPLVACLAVTVALPLAQTPEAWLVATGRIPAGIMVESGVFLLSAVARIGLVLGGAGLVAFGAVAAGETLFLALGLAVMFLVCARDARHWRWDAALARPMLRDALQILLTTFAVTVYRRIDVIILSRLMGESASGIYAAAVRVSEIGYVAPMILHNAWFPRLTQLHAAGSPEYRAALGDYYRRLTWSGASFAAVVTVAAPWLVRLVFGPAFAGAAVPLAVHAWTAVFIAHGIARSQWLLLENRQLDGLWLAAGGAVANVAFNFLLVPRLGLPGAALAAVLALFVNLALLPLLTARTRAGWRFGWRAVCGLPPDRP